MTAPASFRRDGGVVLRPAETFLASRARDFLAAGPADVVPLIEHVCQIPGAPRVVAEHMARALLGERTEFVRDVDGRWRLAERHVAPEAARSSQLAARDSQFADRSSQFSHPDLLSLDYAVVDVETTGTRCWAGDRITEIAVVAVRGGVVADTFETLVNPERPIPPWISRLTNISWDMVKDAPRFRDICDDVVRAMDGAIFVAHNAQFDWRFVTTEVERATGRQLAGRRLCTVRLARKLLPQLRSRRLDYLAMHYGVNITARHRAGGDAVATAEILVRLLRDARSRECHCWPDLEALLGRMIVRSRKRRRSAMPRPVDRDTTA
ncbi:MAG TPA: 3'-5' exonuclease [Gemmatimonadaceae bacterium]|nr:3'-5' exonuclease [Gemmatimonadaceae bacterium]